MQRKLRTSVLAAFAFLWVGFVGISTVASIPFSYNTGFEQVTTTLFTPQYTTDLFPPGTYGPFESQPSYRQSFDGTTLTKQVGIGFMFEPSFSDAQKSAFKAAAVTNIESIWNNKFLITDTAHNRSFPLGVAVMTTGPVFDQSVNVNPGAGRTNVQNWYAVGLTPQVMAHEFGHMIGLFDEYVGGGVDKHPNPTLSNTGLMGLGALNDKPEMLPRYYQSYLDFMNVLNPGGSFALTVAPEPSTLFLVASGVIGFLASKKLRRFRLRKEDASEE